MAALDLPEILGSRFDKCGIQRQLPFFDVGILRFFNIIPRRKKWAWNVLYCKTENKWFMTTPE